MSEDRSDKSQRRRDGELSRNRGQKEEGRYWSSRWEGRSRRRGAGEEEQEKRSRSRPGAGTEGLQIMNKVQGKIVFFYSTLMHFQTNTKQ